MYGLDAPARTRLDMTLTRADFARQIRAAFPSAREPSPGLFSGQDEGCEWSVQLQPAAPLKLGLFELERWWVDVAVLAQSAAERAQWWQRFSAHFQKGGG
ncbi:hypothetical protein [Thiomonas bhubaneswarensis]|uniref:Uncharacterized protein n=1 Tax=Thiomonas bhubaneswarensis TaxID=339866 RepID=A0A0K6HR23_9BURK|nr:hypothetical protein [Thiomonas bhubaneswarensis]CUA93329.1 hypothetical protein Ga0061069_101189 [Thiomonas bhubaneswarensis]